MDEIHILSALHTAFAIKNLQINLQIKANNKMRSLCRSKIKDKSN
jgi:hypothetical protein